MNEKEIETKLTEFKYHILVAYIKQKDKYLTREDILNFIKILEQEQNENE